MLASARHMLYYVIWVLARALNSSYHYTDLWWIVRLPSYGKLSSEAERCMPLMAAGNPNAVESFALCLGYIVKDVGFRKFLGLRMFGVSCLFLCWPF